MEQAGRATQAKTRRPLAWGMGAVELPGCFDPLFDNDFDVGKPVARLRF